MKTILTFLFTLPAIPTLYYGDAIRLRAPTHLPNKEGAYRALSCGLSAGIRGCPLRHRRPNPLGESVSAILNGSIGACESLLGEARLQEEKGNTRLELAPVSGFIGGIL